MRIHQLLCIILISILAGDALFVNAFLSHNEGSLGKHPIIQPLQRTPVSRVNGQKDENKGYQFGDLTRGFLKGASKKVNDLTGKDKYELGDLTRWADKAAKGKVSEITGKDDYEFGDLTRMADRVAKEKVANYTGKAEYQVGDLSKEVLRRTWEGQYQLEDVWLALRILISRGIGITAFAKLMPVQVLLELVNVGLAQEVGGKLLVILAGALDERMKSALTGNPKYQLGDITKEKIEEGITAFTGKDGYEFGDITKRISKLKSSSSSSGTPKISLGESSVVSDLVAWDKKFTGIQK